MVHAEKEGGGQPYSGASEILFRVICNRILFLDSHAQRSGSGVDARLNAYLQIYKPSSFGNILEDSSAYLYIRSELLTQVFASAIRGDILCLAEKDPFFLVENAFELLASYTEAIDSSHYRPRSERINSWYSTKVACSATIPLLSDLIIEAERKIKDPKFDILNFRWKCLHSLSYPTVEEKRGRNLFYTRDLEELEKLLSK